jgi:hypothetical protein
MEYKRIFIAHILNTPYEARIILRNILVCSISDKLYNHLCNVRDFSVPDIYISTRSLKHVYDKRPSVAIEYLDILYDALSQPDLILFGKSSGKADFIFCKKLREDKWLVCPIGISYKKNKRFLFCFTFFPARQNYIKKSAILWSREDGRVPPS